jgi:para-aminobenzoate synthetase component I
MDGAVTCWLTAVPCATSAPTPSSPSTGSAPSSARSPTPAPAPGLPALTGGLVGALAYDLGRRIERLPDLAIADRDGPHLSLRVAEVVCAIPPERDRALLLARGLPRSLSGSLPPEQRARARCEEARHRLAWAARARDDARRSRPLALDPQVAWTSLPREEHLAAVESILAAIGAGAVFQVNLAQRLSARWPWRRPRALPRPARRVASHVRGRAARHRCGLHLPRDLPGGGRPSVTTRPIKGTRPRAQDAALDAALADDLATAAKDRAENVMVVDLERNDLGRVCRPGTVRVPELTRVEEHPTVWHLVSTVQGELRPGTGYGTCCAPPSRAARSRGHRRSPRWPDRTPRGVRRGWYCGAIGFLAPGHARLSVAIRTAVLGRDGIVDHGAGGGIVADSDPTSEHAETLDKAAAFLRAVRATRVADRAPELERPPAGHVVSGRDRR